MAVANGSIVALEQNMKPTTVFLARVKEPSGKYDFQPVKIKQGRPVQPANGTGSYYARFSGVRKDVTRGRVVQALASSQIEQAYVEFLNIDTAQKQIRAGQTPSFTGVATMVPAGQTLLGEAIEEYLQNCEAVDNAADTIGSKKRVLHSFRDVCFTNGVNTIETLKDSKVGRKMLLAYLAWMKSNIPTTSVDGARPENTRYARMRRLGAFLKQHGIKIKKDFNASPADPGLLTPNEFPKYRGKTPTKYSEETIATWLKAATVDEADLIWFFLSTGFRDEEVAYCEWSDINFRDHTINVHAKQKTATRPWSWEPKDGESRPVDIPLSADFVKRMEARKKRYESQKCDLIFPSGVCKPNEHLLRIVRKAAKRAGIAEIIGLHKIRKTFACYFAKEHGIELVRQLLGHSDIATTQLYLSADASDVEKMRKSLDKMTEVFTS